MNTLSKSYIQLRKFNDAYELTNECIKTSTIVNGKDHGATLYHMLSLIDIYTFEGRHEEAQKLLREYIAKINKDDIQYLDILCRLASNCISTSQYEEGQKLYEECLEKCRSQQGGNHPLTISIMMNLANVYEEQNKFVQAENIRKECLAKSIVINGKDHPHTILAMKSLAKK
jgi:tetratricopeptide (TPR) repeat protein